MEVAGLGKLSPNMMLIGFQEKWSSDPEGAREYVKSLLAAFDLHLSVAIFRLQGGFDISALGSTEPKESVELRLFLVTKNYLFVDDFIIFVLKSLFLLSKKRYIKKKVMNHFAQFYQKECQCNVPRLKL